MVPTTLVCFACSSARALSSNRLPLAWAGVGGRSFGRLHAGSQALAPRAVSARRSVPGLGYSRPVPARCMAVGEPGYTLQDRLDAHNEVIEEVMREAAEDFAARPATVEVALEAPAKWWSTVVHPRLDRIAGKLCARLTRVIALCHRALVAPPRPDCGALQNDAERESSLLPTYWSESTLSS